MLTVAFGTVAKALAKSTWTPSSIIPGFPPELVLNPRPVSPDPPFLAYRSGPAAARWARLLGAVTP